VTLDSEFLCSGQFVIPALVLVWIVEI